jgi:hypothetical protein
MRILQKFMRGLMKRKNDFSDGLIGVKKTRLTRFSLFPISGN